ncbi:MAG: hypothetical protein MUE46_12445 [Xanthomonadales bacterium]|jgi:ABC-type hemin transport system ATPase subunit|nr:hypothetical protein [Xanthomonadales bacterium]
MLLQLPSVAVTGPLYASPSDWLVCSGLYLRRQGRVVLDQINLQCRTGEWLALVDPVGDTGAALLALIEGRVRPDAGTVRGANGRQLGFASVLGALRWPVGLTPRQLCAGLERHLAAEQLAAYGLERRMDRPLGEWSALESRLLQLLLASAGPERTLLLDDPLRDLDPAARTVFLRAAAALRSRWPQALWRVPDFDGLQACCERRIDLDQGRICGDRRVSRAGAAARPAPRGGWAPESVGRESAPGGIRLSSSPPARSAAECARCH